MSLVSRITAVCAVLAAVACENKSLTDLSSPNHLTVPDQVAFAATVSGSGFRLKAPRMAK